MLLRRVFWGNEKISQKLFVDIIKMNAVTFIGGKESSPLNVVL